LSRDNGRIRRKRMKKKKPKWVKIISMILGIIVVLGVSGYFYIAYHPQVIVGFIQKALYPNNAEINPTNPQKESAKNVREESHFIETLKARKIFSSKS
jgi:flagellar basal body-associated protein FliL